MERKTPSSFGARVYALLLWLYPASFRREYGESMLQLFNDQRRSARGAGGYAMLWLKTLRDLVLSVPEVHSQDPSRKPSNGAGFIWTVIVVMALVFLLNAVVLPSWIARTPGEGAPAVAGITAVAPTSEDYREVAQVAVAVVSTVLAIGAFMLARRQRNVLTGAAVFVAGAGLVFMALAMNPWLWVPLDRYPPGIAWALGVWPLVAFAWIVLTVRGRPRYHENPR